MSDDLFDYKSLPKVAYSPDLARALGNRNAAIYLSQLIYYWLTFRPGRGRRPLWSADDFERDTALTRHEQDSARALLRRRGIIIEQPGAGFKMKRIIDEKALESLFPACHSIASQLATNRQASLPNSGRQLATNRQASLPNSGKLIVKKEKRESTAKPGPVQADLAFADKDKVVKLFEIAPFPWKEKPAKGNQA